MKDEDGKMESDPGSFILHPSSFILHPSTLICPVCRAEQPWSDSCRRCRCDLSLLRKADQARRLARQQSEEHLRAGRWAEAHRMALALYDLDRGRDAPRLLALCCLLAGDFARAAEWADFEARMTNDERRRKFK
jgi:predicted amidophosphoribosyltransferase